MVADIQDYVELISNLAGNAWSIFHYTPIKLALMATVGKFYNNEVDIHLSMSNDLKTFCFFDDKEQALKRRDPTKDKMPDDVAKYFDDKNVFKCKECHQKQLVRGLLKRHAERHIKKLSVVCVICNHSCPTRSALYAHMKIKH